jgi:hypothetical protein
MTVWKLKSCPRCRGDIYLERDSDSYYEHCLQCGYLNLISTAADMERCALKQDEVDYSSGIVGTVIGTVRNHLTSVN